MAQLVGKIADRVMTELNAAFDLSEFRLDFLRSGGDMEVDRIRRAGFANAGRNCPSGYPKGPVVYACIKALD
jgi:hypothetical protein